MFFGCGQVRLVVSASFEVKALTKQIAFYETLLIRGAITPQVAFCFFSD